MLSPEPRPRPAAAGLKWFLRLGITAALLYWVLSTATLGQVATTLAAASPALVAAAWVLGLMDAGLAAGQLRVLTRSRGLSPGVGKLLEIQLSSQFYGLLLPGYLAGGAIRWYKLARADRKPLEAAGAILTNRVLETGMLMGLGLFCWAFDPVAPASSIGAGFLVAALVLAAGYVALPVGKAFRLNGRDHAAVGSFFLLRQTLGIAGTYWLALAVGIDVSLMTIGWILPMVKLVTLLPLSISGFGVREGSLALALAPLGVPAAAAVGLSLLMFSRVLLQGLLGGALELRHVRSGMQVGEAS